MVPTTLIEGTSRTTKQDHGLQSGDPIRNSNKLLRTGMLRLVNIPSFLL